MSLASRAALLLSLILCAPGCALYAALDDSDVEADQAPAFDLGDDMTSPDQAPDMPPAADVYDTLAACLDDGCEAGGVNLCAQRGDDRFDCRSPEQIHACAQSVPVSISNARILSTLEQGGGVVALAQADSSAEIVFARFAPGAANAERKSLNLLSRRVLSLAQGRVPGEITAFLASPSNPPPGNALSLQRYDLNATPAVELGGPSPLGFEMGSVELCAQDELFFAQPYPFGMGDSNELRVAALLCARYNGMPNWLLAGFAPSGAGAGLSTRYHTNPEMFRHYSATLAELFATSGLALVYVVRDRPSMGGPDGYELSPYLFDLSQPSNALPQKPNGVPVLSVPNNYQPLPGTPACDLNKFLGRQPPIPWLMAQANGKLVQAVIAGDAAGYGIFGQNSNSPNLYSLFCETSGRYHLRGVAHDPTRGAAILLERGEGEKTIALAGFGKPFAKTPSEPFGHERVDLLRPIAGKFSALQAANAFHLGARVKIVGTREAGGMPEIFMLETNEQARPVCR